MWQIRKPRDETTPEETAERTEGKPEYRVCFDASRTGSAALLRGILDLGLPIISFSVEKKHLNQAFMDLTERGVRS